MSEKAIWLQTLRVASLTDYGDCFHIPPDLDFALRTVAASLLVLD